MQKWNVRLAVLCVVNDGVTVAKGPAAAVLTRQPHRSVFEKQRSPGERFRKTPIERSARVEELAAPIDQHSFYFWQNIEILRHARETIDDLRQRFRADGSGDRRTGIFWLENRG